METVVFRMSVLWCCLFLKDALPRPSEHIPLASTPQLSTPRWTKTGWKSLGFDPLFTLAHPSFPARQSKTCFIFFRDRGKSTEMLVRANMPFSFGCGGKLPSSSCRVCCFHHSSSTEINSFVGDCSQRAAAIAMPKEMYSDDPATMQGHMAMDSGNHKTW